MADKIFINYRREDSQHPAGRLYDQLEPEFGEHQIFIDVDHIDAGADFVEVLNNEVSKCDVMLSIIAKKWLDVVDQKTGVRRLDNPDDFVRIEIEAALARGVTIIPVLVDGADMPNAENLPDSLKLFSQRNAVRLTHERFRDDSAGLIKSIKQALAKLEGKKSAEQRQEANRLAMEKLALRLQMDDSAFEQASATNTVEAYRSYLVACPNGEHVKKAKAALKILKPFPIKAVVGSLAAVALLAGGGLVWQNWQLKPTIPETVYIPGGTFSMGCVSGMDCFDSEKPVHSVTVSSFYMSKYETTSAQWGACAAEGYCDNDPAKKHGDDYGLGRGNRPMVYVSWNDAVT